MSGAPLLPETHNSIITEKYPFSGRKSKY